MDELNTSTKFKPGDSVWCRLVSREPGGYLVTLTPSGIEGFLPSQDPIDIGRVVPTTFVCMNGERALLTYAFVMGTTERVQVSTDSDQENAFAVWADSYPIGNRLRRGVDLVMPPISSSPIMFKQGDKTAENILAQLEATEFTGCVKVFSEERLSRSAVIFHRGRAVGCIYTTKLVVDPYSFEISLKKMLEDIKAPHAELEMYDLPADIVLSMSALFLGYVDHREEELDNQHCSEKMLDHLVDWKETACLSLLDESSSPCALAFVCNGEFKGAYAISERVFGEERNFLQKLVENYPGTRLQAYILPAAMTTDSVRFGYSLTSKQFASD